MGSNHAAAMPRRPLLILTVLMFAIIPNDIKATLAVALCTHGFQSALRITFDALDCVPACQLQAVHTFPSPSPPAEFVCSACSLACKMAVLAAPAAGPAVAPVLSFPAQPRAQTLGKAARAAVVKPDRAAR